MREVEELVHLSPDGTQRDQDEDAEGNHSSEPYAGKPLFPDSWKTCEAVDLRRWTNELTNTSGNRDTYLASSVHPQQDENNTGGHPVDVIELRN